MDIKINGMFVEVCESNELKYSFDIERLKIVWEYATEETIEYIYAYATSSELLVALTTASDQGGIIAVIDIANDEIIHYHKGAYVRCAVIVEDKVVSLHCVHYWGIYPYYCVESMDKNLRDMSREPKLLKLSNDIQIDEVKYPELNIAVQNNTLTIINGENKYVIDISEIL